MRTEPHPSFQNVMNATLAGNKGQFMAPAQLADLAEAQIAAQAAQQAAVQQAAAAQAAQAAQAAALPAPPPMAGPPMSPAQLAQQVGALSCPSLLRIMCMPAFQIHLGAGQGSSACQACKWSVCDTCGLLVLVSRVAEISDYSLSHVLPLERSPLVRPWASRSPTAALRRPLQRWGRPLALRPEPQAQRRSQLLQQQVTCRPAPAVKLQLALHFSQAASCGKLAHRN